MLIKRRLDNLERNFHAKSGSIVITVIMTEKLPEGGKENVNINGKICFTGTPEECDKWIDENYGNARFKVGVGWRDKMSF